MTAINQMFYALLLSCTALLPACPTADQDTGEGGLPIVACGGNQLLTLAEVEAVLGGSWRLGSCYYEGDDVDPRVRCSFYLSADPTSKSGLKIVAANDVPAATIKADVKNTFIDSIEGQAKVFKGIGDKAYYGAFIHKEANTIRRKLWVVEGAGRRSVFIDLHTPGVATNAADDATALESLRVLANKALQSF